MVKLFATSIMALVSLVALFGQTIRHAQSTARRGLKEHRARRHVPKPNLRLRRG